MGACMDTTTTREGTQNVLEGQSDLAVCMVFQLLCMIFDFGIPLNCFGQVYFVFNALCIQHPALVH